MPNLSFYGGPITDGYGVRPVQLGTQWKFGETLNRDVFARLGKVIRVDEENGVVDLMWLDYGGTAKEVAMALPYATRRGVGHGMPSRGAVAICVFVKYSSRIGKPVVVGWSKAPWVGAKRGDLELGFGMYSTLSHDFIVDRKIVTMRDRIGAGAERLRLRKAHPGDVHWMSDHGGEVYLDENVQLSSGALDELLLRSDDQTASLVTGTNRVATEAGRRRFGVAYRNEVISWQDEEFDKESKEEEKDDKDPEILSVRRKLTFESRILPVVTRAGKYLYIPTPLVSKDTVDAGSTPWVEDILEMREVGDCVKDVCEEAHDHDLDSLYPSSSAGDNHTDIFIKRVLGTYLGNDPTDKASYGVPLYRRIFASFDSFAPDAPEKDCRLGVSPTGDPPADAQKKAIDPVTGEEYYIMLVPPGVNMSPDRYYGDDRFSQAERKHRGIARLGKTKFLAMGGNERQYNEAIDNIAELDAAREEEVPEYVKSAIEREEAIERSNEMDPSTDEYKALMDDIVNWEENRPEIFADNKVKGSGASGGPKWIPINRTYLEGDTIESAGSIDAAGLGGDEDRLRIRENQEASILHTEFAHTGQFGRNADADNVRNTAFDITKEGVLQFMISASSDEHTIVCTEGKEESQEQDAWKSSGRSVEGHFEGSVKLSHAANTNEEESFRQTAIGKFVTLWGASEHHFGEEWKDKKRADAAATAFVMDGHPGQDGGGPGKQVLELKGEGETERLDWPVLPTGLSVANRRRSERRSTWGGLDWFLGRTVDNRTSWNLATAGQIKQWIGATPAPSTVNEEEAEATNVAGRANCSVVRHTVGSVEEHIGKNEKDESWNTVFDGQVKHRIGYTEVPDNNTDDELDVIGPNGPGRVRNSINRQVLGSIEEHVGVNDKEETYNAVFDGQVKHRIGFTTVLPEERLNTGTEPSMLVKGPNGPGRVKSSIVREILGSVEEHVGVNDQEESHSAVLDGQLKMRIGATTTSPSKRRNTGEGLDVSGPLGAGDKGNSVNLQLLGSFEANVGKNQTMGDSVYINTEGGWDINIIGPDNSQKAMNLLAKGDWADAITGKQTRTISGEYTRTAQKHTLVGDVVIEGNLTVNGDVTVTGDLHADGEITDSNGNVHSH